jgi:hypothetical protein
MAHASISIHLKPEDVSHGFPIFGFVSDGQILGSLKLTPDAVVIGTAEEFRALASAATEAADKIDAAPKLAGLVQ